jgi:glyoxalase family protein
MALEGLHHVTAITGDARRNVEFHVGLLGLRMVKKTVNFDAPDVYHLYYADETGTPGSVMTFFEFPGARPGRAGDGMVHTVQWRVGTEQALDFWSARLEAAGVATDRTVAGTLRFADPEGLAHELVIAGDLPDAPLAPAAPDVPAEHALLGFHGVRAFAADPQDSVPVLEALGLERRGDVWEARGAARGATIAYDPAPAAPGVPGAGTVHHIAWSAADDAELDELRRVAARAGMRPTPIIDRQYFHSVYFREPSGVLFELASRDIGFDADEPLGTLGQALKLPSQHEHLRAKLEASLTPLPDPRSDRAAAA